MSPQLEECVNDFEEEIILIWNEYGKEDSSKLTSDAKDLKAKILQASCNEASNESKSKNRYKLKK